MLSRRELSIACGASVLTAVSLMAYAQTAKVIGPSVYDWNKIPPTKTAVGEVRQVLKGPTATLKQLELHVTTLNPGASSHPPHQHANEELIIIDTGTVETLSGGEWKRLGPGSVILNATNSLHSLKNVGSEPATYHVINWETGCSGKP